MTDSHDREYIEKEIAEIDLQISALKEHKKKHLAKLAVSNVSSNVDVLTSVNKTTFSIEAKTELFKSYFKGRKDIYARRWENYSGRSGYSPVCKYEWDKLLCLKPKIKCSNCENRHFLPFDSSTITKHLNGEITAGIYPLLNNDNCYFLAIDFDGDSWSNDINAVMETCVIENISAAMERSRSGKGGHLWMFFSEEVSAISARKLGTGLISKTMVRHCQLSMKSYDRLFPNQDTIPKGGFGNLIALPLQKKTLLAGNGVFINKSGLPYSDQWAYLASINKLSRDETETLVDTLKKTGGKIPARWSFIDEEEKPWMRPPSGKRHFNVNIKELPNEIEAVLSNRIYIKTEHIPSALINQFKHLAAFHNPDFYKKQKMRFSTHATPRVICCAELDTGWLSIPRGCMKEVKIVLNDYGIKLKVEDKRFHSAKTDFVFLGNLYDIQQVAFNDIVSADFGVLSAPPGFGKTVIAAAVIAKRKKNTLILVNRKPLMYQWQIQLSALLGIDKKKIGLIGGGKNSPTELLDVGMVQSMDICHGVDDRIAKYGFVIMDECHHVGASSFEKVMNQVKAKYVLGLTATPYRRDGHQPIIHMQCGPLIHRIKDKDSIACAPNSKVIVRTTTFKADWNDNSKIHELWPKLTANEERNKQILNDIEEVLDTGRFPLILTERREHLALFETFLKDKIDFLVVLHGGLRQKKRQEIFEELKGIPDNSRKAILATGSYIGEGFDSPRLDTLFLTMPASFKGKIVQVIGE
ncbi:MAG: DEAD/DEAH box helicase family protein [Candidatus Omnitrophota bacterium]